MTQADGNIANQTFPATRTDLNNQLSAIFTNHSGGTAPATTFANQWWVDTANNLLKQRNNANTAWTTKFPSDANGVSRTNAGDPNGSITGNYEGELLFDTTNDVLWIHTGSGTVWVNTFGGSTSSQLPTNYHDVNIDYFSNSQIIILAGSRARSTDDTRDVIFSSDYTIDITDSTPDSSQGGSSVSESPSTWYYVYIALDSSGDPIGWLDTANEAGGGTPTNPASYSSGKRQLKFAVRNDASSDFLPFDYYDNNKVRFSDFEASYNGLSPYSVLNAGSAASDTDVDLSSFVPPVSSFAPISIAVRNQSVSATRTPYVKTKGQSNNGFVYLTIGDRARFNSDGEVWIATDSSNVIQYNATSADVDVDICVLGFEVTEVL